MCDEQKVRTNTRARTCTHTQRHADRGLDSLSGSHRSPAGPSTGVLMGCGIDRPSVTVSRCITVNGRGTQKSRGEARGKGEGKGKGGDGGFKLVPAPREPRCVFLPATPPYPGRKDLIPNKSPNPKFTISFPSSRSSSCCPCFSSLYLSVSLCRGTMVSQLYGFVFLLGTCLRD